MDFSSFSHKELLIPLPSIPYPPFPFSFHVDGLVSLLSSSHILNFSCPLPRLLLFVSFRYSFLPFVIIFQLHSLLSLFILILLFPSFITSPYLLPSLFLLNTFFGLLPSVPHSRKLLPSPPSSSLPHNLSSPSSFHPPSLTPLPSSPLPTPLPYYLSTTPFLITSPFPPSLSLNTSPQPYSLPPLTPLLTLPPSLLSLSSLPQLNDPN